MQPLVDLDPIRQQALTHWQTFCTYILPRTVRRIVAWKRLSPRRQAELREELRQELAADCLANAAQVVEQPLLVRHGRWLRLAERYVYRHYVAVPRQAGPDDPHAEAPVTGPAPDVPEPPELASFGNGRRNLLRSARQLGLDVRELRRRVDGLAKRLGENAERRAFWRARLAEALTGLAADLLRDHDLVQLLPRARRRPDPAGRLQRLRGLLAHFPIRPSTSKERAILRQWLKRPDFGSAAPRQLLAAATGLAPTHTATWLWLFEACLADGDLRAAARALRRGRQQAPPAVAATTLARARLLEARGRAARAMALVQRSAQRWPRDATLREVAARWPPGGPPPRSDERAAQGTEGGAAPSNACSSCARTRSAAASPRGADHPGSPNHGVESQRSSTSTTRPPSAAASR